MSRSVRSSSDALLEYLTWSAVTTARSAAKMRARCVNLYKALGGGRVDAADKLTPAGEAASIETRERMQPMF